MSLKMIWRQRRSNKLNFAVSKRKLENILPCLEIRSLEFYHTSSAIYQLSNNYSSFFVSVILRPQIGSQIFSLGYFPKFSLKYVLSRRFNNYFVGYPVGTISTYQNLAFCPRKRLLCPFYFSEYIFVLFLLCCFVSEYVIV